MKHLKKFNESIDSKPDLIPLEQIENYFFDITDDGVEMILENLSHPYIKKDGNDRSSSMIPRKGYNFYQRKLVFTYNFSSNEEIKNIEKSNKLMSVFLECLKRFSVGERVFIFDFNLDVGKVSYRDDLIISFIFIQDISNVKQLDDDISDYFLYFDDLVSKKSQSAKVNWSKNKVKLRVDGKKIIIDCEELTKPQIRKLAEFISKKTADKRINAQYRFNRFIRDNIEIDGASTLFEYYKYNLNIVKNSIIIDNIEKLSFNNE